jgi:hypothetical protein
MKENPMQKRNYWYLSAALLCLFMMGMQIFVGSPQLNAPIQQSSLPPGIRAVAEVAWHSHRIDYWHGITHTTKQCSIALKAIPNWFSVTLNSVSRRPIAA